VYSALIDAIDEQDDGLVEGPDGRTGWPAADGDAGRPDGDGNAGRGAGAREGYQSVDVTQKFREGVKKSSEGVGGAGAFASAFEAKALRKTGPQREELFESDPYLLELGKALAQNASDSASSARASAPRTALPGRKSIDTDRLQAMMSRVNSAVPSTAPPAAATPAASRGTEELRNAVAPDLLAADAAAAAGAGGQDAVGSGGGMGAGVGGGEAEEQEEGAMAESGAGAALAAKDGGAEQVDAAAKATAATEEAEDRVVVARAEQGQGDSEADAADGESPLLTSPVPVQLIQSLGLLQGQASALPSTASTTAASAPSAAQAEQPLAPITAAPAAGCAESVMTYNALVSVLQRRVDSRLESLMGTIDAQALAARREMILTQMTPEAIALNCLTDILENKIVPMQDTQTRLGPRLRDVDLDWSYKERLWELHDRLQNDFKFRMLFVPSYVRASWHKKKESIRAGSLEVRAVTLQRRRRAAAEEKATSTTPLDLSGDEARAGLAEDDVDDDASEVAATRALRASSAWEKLKAQARLQRPGTRTATRQAPSGAAAPAAQRSSSGGSEILAVARPSEGGALFSDIDSASESSEPFSERFSEDEFGSLDSFENIEGVSVTSLYPDPPGGGSGKLPISASMSLAEIREFLRRESLDSEVKTSGAGRTKQAILKDAAAVWLRRQQ